MTIIYFILILGGIVFFHELGHFIFAKKAGVYVYEFSIGMGPRILKRQSKKDETIYSLRLFPIGGFVQMAGEEVELDESVPKEKRMQSKTLLQRFLIMVAGVAFNFIMAIVLLFIVGLVGGSPTSNVQIKSLDETTNAYASGLRNNYQIVSINNKKITSQDILMLELIANAKKEIKIEYKMDTGEIKTTSFSANEVTSEGNTSYKYGFSLQATKEHGVLPAIKYSFIQLIELIKYMWLMIFYLVTGTLSVTNLSGPIGIFNIVGQTAKTGFISLINLMALISVNVGFINFLPLPAFDGGRILFLIIEKIKGSPVNTKVENIIHTVGFILLMILMVFVTYNDILRLFK